MRRAPSIVLVGLLASFAIGCGVSVEVATLSPPGSDYASVPTDSVRVFHPPVLTDSLSRFLGGEPVLLTSLSGYVSIARLSGKGDGYGTMDSDVDDVIQELREKAGELGANAIYVESTVAREGRNTCSEEPKNRNDGSDGLIGILIDIAPDEIIRRTPPCVPHAGHLATAQVLAILSRE